MSADLHERPTLPLDTRAFAHPEVRTCTGVHPPCTVERIEAVDAERVLVSYTCGLAWTWRPRFARLVEAKA